MHFRPGKCDKPAAHSPCTSFYPQEFYGMFFKQLLLFYHSLRCKSVQFSGELNRISKIVLGALQHPDLGVDFEVGDLLLKSAGVTS